MAPNPAKRGALRALSLMTITAATFVLAGPASAAETVAGVCTPGLGVSAEPSCASIQEGDFYRDGRFEGRGACANADVAGGPGSVGDARVCLIDRGPTVPGPVERVYCMSVQYGTATWCCVFVSSGNFEHHTCGFV